MIVEQFKLVNLHMKALTDSMWQLEPLTPASTWTVVAHSQAGHADRLL